MWACVHGAPASGAPPTCEPLTSAALVPEPAQAELIQPPTVGGDHWPNTQKSFKVNRKHEGNAGCVDETAQHHCERNLFIHSDIQSGGEKWKPFLAFWSDQEGIFSLELDFRSSKVSLLYIKEFMKPKPGQLHFWISLSFNSSQSSDVGSGCSIISFMVQFSLRRFSVCVWRRHLAMCSPVRRTKATTSRLRMVLVPGCPPASVGFWTVFFFWSLKKGSAMVEHIQQEAIEMKTTISWSVPTIHSGWPLLSLCVPECGVWHEVLDEIRRKTSIYLLWNVSIFDMYLDHLGPIFKATKCFFVYLHVDNNEVSWMFLIL